LEAVSETKRWLHVKDFIWLLLLKFSLKLAKSQEHNYSYVSCPCTVLRIYQPLVIRNPSPSSATTYSHSGLQTSWQSLVSTLRGNLPDEWLAVNQRQINWEDLHLLKLQSFRGTSSSICSAQGKSKGHTVENCW